MKQKINSIKVNKALKSIIRKEMQSYYRMEDEFKNENMKIDRHCSGSDRREFITELYSTVDTHINAVKKHLANMKDSGLKRINEKDVLVMELAGLNNVEDVYRKTGNETKDEWLGMICRTEAKVINSTRSYMARKLESEKRPSRIVIYFRQIFVRAAEMINEIVNL